MCSSLWQSDEGMKKPFWLKVRVTSEGQMFEPLFHVHSISPTFFESFLWNLAQMLSSLRQYAKGMSRPFWFKVKVTLFKLVEAAKWLSGTLFVYETNLKKP